MDRRIALCLCLLAGLVVGTSCSSGAAAERLPTRAPTPTTWATATPVPARAYYEQGLARRRAGDTEAALRAFSWAIEQAPDLASAYVARGGIYLAQGALASALTDAEAALDADPESAAAYALRGEVLWRQGRPRLALRSFELAVALEPALKPELFRSRWLAALAADDGSQLSALAEEYAAAHPDDPLRHYYRQWAHLALGRPELAIQTLVPRIEALSDPPAVLWFTLGRAYAAEGLWKEAIVAFEATRGLVQAGDTSLTIHSARPLVELFVALGEAYLGGGRCFDAETMLTYAISIGASEASLAPALEEARICQTPTPAPTETPSPW